jgi:hypothetical protein
MITSLILTFSSTKRASSVMKERPTQSVPTGPSQLPVQPQVPGPEPKK